MSVQSTCKIVKTDQVCLRFDLVSIIFVINKELFSDLNLNIGFVCEIILFSFHRLKKKC